MANELGSAARSRLLEAGRSLTGLDSCARIGKTHNRLTPMNNPSIRLLVMTTPLRIFFMINLSLLWQGSSRTFLGPGLTLDPWLAGILARCVSASQATRCDSRLTLTQCRYFSLVGTLA